MSNRLISIFFFFYFCNVLNATPVKLSVNDAVSLAYQNHEEIKKAKVGIEKLENQYKEAFSYALPKVTYQLNWNTYPKAPVLSADMGPPIGAISAPMKQPYELDLKATLTQPVWTFGKVSTALDIADSAREIQRYSYSVTKAEIKYQTKYLYNTVLYIQKILDIAKKSLNNAKNNKKKLQNKFNYGRISRYDNIKMAADVASRIPTVLEAENNLDLALINFKLITGIPKEQEIEFTDILSDNFPQYSQDTVENDLFLNEPSLKILKSNIELYNDIARLKKANKYPSIGFFTQYQYSGHSHHAFVGSKYMNHMFVLGFSISGTLWSSGEISSIHRQALNDATIAELEYTKRKKQLNAEIQSAISDYNSSLKTYKANLSALKLAEKSYTVSVSSFASGQISQMNLNDAELMLTRVKMGTEQTLYKINNLIAKVERLTTGEN